jgi:hypothetical protein
MKTTKLMSFEELVNLESRHLAREAIESYLSKQDLPLPKDSALEFHIDALIKTKPEIIEAAKDRVSARTDAYSAGLKALGISAIIDQPLELDL